MEKKEKQTKKEEIIKPLSLRIDEAKNRITNSFLVITEDCQLDWFHLKIIIDDLARQISVNAEQQLTKEREYYEKQIKNNTNVKGE